MHVKLKFPATVEIAVEECVKTAYVKHLDKYICIDKNGKILEILNGEENENLIVVTGVVPTKFEVGAKITLKDGEKNLTFSQAFFRKFRRQPICPMP
ncbi:MAG: hypothetical protein L6V93_15835 [Clostridiales bacterium]|nr:MAG: hypothetical protein L6V93_15835 [Clostridiales bacterium]